MSDSTFSFEAFEPLVTNTELIHSQCRLTLLIAYECRMQCQALRQQYAENRNHYKRLKEQWDTTLQQAKPLLQGLDMLKGSLIE